MLAQPTQIGTDLKLERERQGRSLRDVAGELNISASILEAIESNRRDGLPGVGYVLGYVRAFAEELGYGGELAVDRYKAEMAIPDNLRLRDAPHIVTERKKPLPRGLFPALAVLGAAVAFAVYYGWQSQVVPEDGGAVAQDVAPMTVDANTLTLRSETASWIDIRAIGDDGEYARAWSGIMVPGQELSFPKSAAPVVDVRDAGAVMLLLGGEEVGLLGAQGESLEGLGLSEVLERPRVAVGGDAGAL